MKSSVFIPNLLFFMFLEDLKCNCFAENMPKTPVKTPQNTPMKKFSYCLLFSSSTFQELFLQRHDKNTAKDTKEENFS